MYLLQGKLNAQAGHAEALADILLQASQLVAKAQGCKLYVIGKKEEEPFAVYVTEIWNSKADHDNSLKGDEVRALIMQAMPLLDGMPEKGQELEILGGYLK